MKERTHPAYKSNKELLQFYIDSYLGGDNYCQPHHLHKHHLEEEQEFTKRVKRAYYLNYVSTVVKVYTQYTCPTSLPREVNNNDSEFFEKLNDNCTGDGTDLATFIRDISDFSSVCGYAGVLVDGTGMLENVPQIPTAAHDRSVNPPKLRKVLATDLVDWSLDSFGQYNWVIIKSTVYEDSDPTKDRVTYLRYELWTRTERRYFIKVEGSKEDELTEQGVALVHNLGVVPFCLFINSRSLLDGIPVSMIKDIALVNREIFNNTSLLQSILADQTFSQLVFPEVNEGEIEEKVVGTKRVLTYNAMANSSPIFIAPPNGPAEVLIKWIQVCISEIFRMAIVRKSGAATTDQYSTAYGKAVDFEDTEAALREKADLMESCEYNLSMIVNKWRGESGYLWSPSYPKKFDVRELGQLLSDALQFDALGMGTEFMVELKKNLAKLRFPSIDNEILEKIYKSIREYTEIEVEEIENATIDMDSSPSNFPNVGNDPKNKEGQAG